MSVLLQAEVPRRRLVDLGSGVYSVSEVCRILQPGMTPRKVHYWLNTGLLFSGPLRWGSRGYPTLLSFRQLLEIRTVQHLRDELTFSLPKVRDAFAWILLHLFALDASDLRFTKGVDGALVARAGDEQMVVPGGQGVLPGALPELNEHLEITRRAWRDHAFVIPGRQFLVTNALVLGGAPIVNGTRIDTALLAGLVQGEAFDDAIVEEIRASYSRLPAAAIVEALEFEGLRLVA